MDVLLLILRWIHFMAGITWIGLLYFFNLVNVNFLKALDAPTRGKVVPILMPSALWWFRWGAMITVLAGLFYIWLGPGFSQLFTTSWGISITIGGGLGIIMFLNVWLIIWPCQKQVIRMTADFVAKGQPAPPEMAGYARKAFLASRTNFWLSIPMLFFMGSATHLKLF
ncbi:MAG: urate hydroxylase PuuD [Deltaproteobacteria bacterium]|nr:urate hydroxylase PuuD [Deltaproteobacteria bacterium]